MLTQTAMQMCTPGKGFRERLLDWQFIEAGTCQYADTTGFLTFGMLVYGAIFLAVFLASDSYALPAVMLLLVGGGIIAQMAAPAVPFVLLAIIGTGAGAVAYLYAQLSRA